MTLTAKQVPYSSVVGSSVTLHEPGGRVVAQLAILQAGGKDEQVRIAELVTEAINGSGAGDVSDRAAKIERMGRAMERARNPQWDDESFEVWWNRDPFFVDRLNVWNGFQGTGKQKVLWEAEQALTALEAGAQS